MSVPSEREYHELRIHLKYVVCMCAWHIYLEYTLGLNIAPWSYSQRMRQDIYIVQTITPDKKNSHKVLKHMKSAKSKAIHNRATI